MVKRSEVTWRVNSSTCREQVQVRSTPDLFTVEAGADNSYSFDLTGCLVRASWGGYLRRWGLDGSCLEKSLKNPKSRKYLSVADGLARAASGYAQAKVLCEELAQVPPSPWDTVMVRVGESGVQLIESRSARFARIYAPVGILPPDQYGALLLQLTVGCRYNRCAFCTFYEDQRYRVKTPTEFSQHIDAVLDLVGEAINRRYSVFLGDANALGLAPAELLCAMEMINARLPIGPGQIEGIYSFMDVFGPRIYSAREFAALRCLGLRRVYIGAESGSPSVLRALRKPVDPVLLEQAVYHAKEGGVGVGLVFLLGAGGERLGDVHAEETAELLARLPLDGRDVVYFSELVVDPLSDYARWAQAEGVQPLDGQALRRQEAVMRSGLKPFCEGGPALTRYDVREFIYY